MGGLLYEARIGGLWVVLAVLEPGDPPGSISSNTLERRDVILFRCVGDHSVVERSLAAADIEVGAARVFTTADTERLATLAPGQSYEADVVSDRGRAFKARWTHV